MREEHCKAGRQSKEFAPVNSFIPITWKVTVRLFLTVFHRLPTLRTPLNRESRLNQAFRIFSGSSKGIE